MSERTQQAFDFGLSNFQNDRITSMIDNAYEKAGVQAIGEKRHADKQSAMDNGAKGTHEIMQQTGVHSWNTEHKIKGQMHVFAEYCKIEYKTKDLQHITPNMLTSFFENMLERGYSQKTFDSYCSTLERFACIFDKAYGGNRAETWHNEIKASRSDLKGSFVQLNTETRAYNDPERLVSSISSPVCQMVGLLQLNHGLRLSDACKLQEIIESKGVEHSKGGQPIQGLYDRLTPNEKNLLNSLSLADCHGLKNRYQAELKDAAARCGEVYQGKATHGLRHNFAQNTYNEYIKEGCTPHQALLNTAEELGHHRADITQHYLR